MAHVANAFDGEVLLPTQLPTRAAGARTHPELALRLALLEQAVEEYLIHAEATTILGRRLFAEAAHWIWADDDAWPYSFVRVCDVLSFNVAATRVAIEDGRLQGRLPDQRVRANGARRTGTR